MKTMTKRRALQVVLHHAGRDAAGTGCGIRAGMTSAELDELKAAMRKLWPDAYGFAMTQNEFFNMGIS